MKKWLPRLVLLLVGLPLALALLAGGAFLLANRTNLTLVSSGETRRALLHVPPGYDPARPVPLVISLHGYAEWPAHQAHISRWNDLSDEYGFIVVYPSGTGFPLHWRTQIHPNRKEDPTPDIEFIAGLIDHLESQYSIDPARIYANGFSNGGGMSFLLTCSMPQRIAAVGMVSGAFLQPWEACRPSRPVPVVVFHGTEDRVVPFEGGPSRAFNLPFPSISAWVDALAQRNGCAAAPVSLPPSGEVSGVRFTACAADVDFYTVEGGGHAWPGGRPLPRWIAGHITQDVDATRLLWEFFQQHPLPAGD